MIQTPAFWLIVLYGAIVWGSGRAAMRRGMSYWGGVLLGLILGPLGLAILLLMPHRKAS